MKNKNLATFKKEQEAQEAVLAYRATASLRGADVDPKDLLKASSKWNRGWKKTSFWAWFRSDNRLWAKWMLAWKNKPGKSWRQ